MIFNVLATLGPQRLCRTEQRQGGVESPVRVRGNEYRSVTVARELLCRRQGIGWVGVVVPHHKNGITREGLDPATKLFGLLSGHRKERMQQCRRFLWWTVFAVGREISDIGDNDGDVAFGRADLAVRVLVG